MEYLALFFWLAACLLLGGLVHWLVRDALTYRPVRWIAAPGLGVRKFSMAIAALLTGATVTHARLYDAGEDEVRYDTKGASGAARVLAPLAPLFGAACVLALLNATFGGPLRLGHAMPRFQRLDPDGLAGFVRGSALLVSAVVRDFFEMGWRSAAAYVFAALTFSLALGACAPIQRVREPLMGAALVAVALALTAAIAAERTAIGTLSLPAWFQGLNSTVLGYAAVAFVMMVYGTLGALTTAIVVRAWALAHKGQGRSESGKVRRIKRSDEDRDQAA